MTADTRRLQDEALAREAAERRARLAQELVSLRARPARIEHRVQELALLALLGLGILITGVVWALRRRR